MAFEDWFIAHARISSKPHKNVTLDDKMTFFQQLSTLICSGTPLLQAIQISAQQSQSLKMRRVLEPRAIGRPRKNPHDGVTGAVQTAASFAVGSENGNT